MLDKAKFLLFGGILASVTLLAALMTTTFGVSGPAAAPQNKETPDAPTHPPANEAKLENPQTSMAADVVSSPECPRPADAKEVKVISLDTSNLMASLAVNLGDGRFKLAGIKVWNRPEDPRPLMPVLEAARILQAKLALYTPGLNRDPESVHNTFKIMVEAGGKTMCWATPSSLMNEG